MEASGEAGRKDDKGRWKDSIEGCMDGIAL